MYAAALAGLGITGLPSFVAEDALLEHALERVLPRLAPAQHHAVRRHADAQARAGAHARVRRLPGRRPSAAKTATRGWPRPAARRCRASRQHGPAPRWRASPGDGAETLRPAVSEVKLEAASRRSAARAGAPAAAARCSAPRPCARSAKKRGRSSRYLRLAVAVLQAAEDAEHLQVALQAHPFELRARTRRSPSSTGRPALRARLPVAHRPVEHVLLVP